MIGVTEHNIYILLLQLTIIFLLCMSFGEILKKYKQPTITGDILVGIILGPTILGKFFPKIHNYIFPENLIQISMLDTLAWFGLFLVLLSTGIEVDLSSILKQKKDALKISILDILVPIGFSMFFLYFIPNKYLLTENNPLIMNIFISVIMTISALPISIRTMRDLGILKSDMGFLIVSALTINDIIGWIVFTLILSIFSMENFNIETTIKIIAYTTIFTYTALTSGKNLINKIFKIINNRKEESIEFILSVICLIGVVFGLITLGIGIHSLFGFFIAGIIAGDSKELNKRTRNIISKFVYSIFVSLFFVNIGLKIDFFENFNLFLAIFLTVVGVSGRYLGAYLGSLLSKKNRFERNIISIAHTPGGEMHIVVSLLALELGLINSTIFVAIIFAAILSSITAGPWMAFSLKKVQDQKTSTFKIEIYPDVFVEGEKKEEIIEKMISLEGFEDSKESIELNILKQDNIKCSIFKNDIVLLKGVFKELEETVVIFAKIKKGVNWEFIDENFSRNIFLLLVSEENKEIELKIIQKITELSKDCEKVKKLDELETQEEIYQFIEKILK